MDILIPVFFGIFTYGGLHYLCEANELLSLGVGLLLVIVVLMHSARKAHREAK